MSVLKARRKESRAEFVNTADNIHTQTIQFLTRLSARYSRLLAEPTVKLAAEVSSYTAKANDAYPSDPVRAEVREKNLIKARGALSALDSALKRCYDVMMLNPSGCFNGSNGKAIGQSEATARLERMADDLGDMIDREKTMLDSVLKSDKERLKKKL